MDDYRNASDGDEVGAAVASADVNGASKKKKEPSEAVVEEGRYKVSVQLLDFYLFHLLCIAPD